MNQIIRTIKIRMGIWSKAKRNRGLFLTGTSKESVFDPWGAGL
jgi:hypothetical protein